MLKLLLTFMVSLSLVGVNNGQDYRKCTYIKKVYQGKPEFFFNDKYPENYGRGSSCQWVLKSDRPMRLTCNPFYIPYNTGCTLAALVIEDGNQTEKRHCGNGDITLVSVSRKLVVTLTSESNIPTGRFFCTVETVSLPEDDTSCGCGRRNTVRTAGAQDMQFRVVGGEETEVNEFPMMCGLIDMELKGILCGATIINERQVVTAAHCLNRPVREIGVLVGAHNLTKDINARSENLFRAESFTIHPLYNDGTQDYDIAVITIVGMMTFSPTVGPVCLPFQHSPDTFGGAVVDVLGWGSKEFAGGPSNTLQKAQLNVVTNTICFKTYKDLSKRQVCTQGSGRDSCQFDSGGPVLWQNPSTRRLVGIGIISLGSVCADGTPAVNTRIGAFINWIVDQTPEGLSYCTME